MARENILDAIGDIAREKGINREKLIGVIQDAVSAAARRKFKQYEDIEARINIKSGELEVYRYKKVTEDFTDPENQISLDEARRLDSLAEPGDEVEYEIDNKELSRVIAQTARQLIFQKIREAERETIFENFKDRVGEVLNGIVNRTEKGRTFVTFNQTEAILYRREQIPNERYAPGDHIRVILLDVLNDPREPSQLVISRADPLLLTKMFEMEVPEIYEGIVEIVTAAREPGRRAKIAVRSHDQDVDAVGACVGLRGSRVQSIIAELRGEKIDIIHYTEDLPTYVANGLAPAELTRIKINEEEKEIDVEVEPDQLSLAIGRQGQNVRLASKLLGYRINIRSTTEAAPSLEEQIRQRLLASAAQMGMAMAPGTEGEAGAIQTPTEEGVEAATSPEDKPAVEAGEPEAQEGGAPRASEEPSGEDRTEEAPLEAGAIQTPAEEGVAAATSPEDKPAVEAGEPEAQEGDAPRTSEEPSGDDRTEEAPLEAGAPETGEQTVPEEALSAAEESLSTEGIATGAPEPEPLSEMAPSEEDSLREPTGDNNSGNEEV